MEGISATLQHYGKALFFSEPFQKKCQALKSFDARLYTAHSLSSSYQLTMRKQQCAKLCRHRPSCMYSVSCYLTVHVLYSQHRDDADMGDSNRKSSVHQYVKDDIL